MIFNPHLIKLHHEFAAKNIGESDFLIEHAASEIMHDISLLNLTPQNILEIGPRAGHLSRKLKQQYPDAQLTCSDDSATHHNRFDLITSCMNFHWINEVEKHLRHIHSILTDDGKLVLNFAASGSLEHLKQHLLQCELYADIGHSPHIMPFPKEEKIQTMFQQCGFKFVVVSTEKIELEYETPIRLMKDLKNMGENNALVGGGGVLPRGVLKDKPSYSAQARDSENLFHDIINLVTVVAGKNG